jgi:hypothetical protein
VGGTKGSGFSFCVVNRWSIFFLALIPTKFSIFLIWAVNEIMMLPSFVSGQGTSFGHYLHGVFSSLAADTPRNYYTYVLVVLPECYGPNVNTERERLGHISGPRSNGK